MKFLILAICVCVAHANPATPWKSQAKASVKVQPALVKAVPQAVHKASAHVAGTGSDAEIAILKSASSADEHGYQFSYETQNGIAAEVDGTLKKVDDAEVFAVKGWYQYESPDGTPVKVSYVADENGYQAQSDAIPVAPPVPVAIARALEYIATHPQKSDSKF